MKRSNSATLAMLFMLTACDGAPLIADRGAGKDNWADALPRPEWQALDRVPTKQPWFEVYQVGPGVLAIYEPGHFEEVISYLIAGTERAVLFDTGLGIGNIAELVSTLTDLEVGVVNSHSHFDHVGGNHQFEGVAVLDSDFARARSAGLPHDEVAFAVADGWIAAPTPPGFDPARYRIEPFTISRALQDGEMIDLGGRTLEVIATPGHSPDSICLLDRGNRLLFTGDTFYLAPLYAHLPESNVEHYADTAARLAPIASLVDHLLPGHNVTRIDARYLERLAAAFAAITSNTVTFAVTDGVREYAFDGFSILTPATQGD